MRYGILSVICLLLLSGCNDGSTSSEDDTVINEDTIFDNNEDDNEDIIDYSLIRCEDELLEAMTLINDIRSEPQVCGDALYPAVGELSWNEALTFAAEEHSNNMANYDFFSHEGLDGSSAGTRVTAQGYTWSYVAENIAAGQSTLQKAIDGWMKSEGHCKNIMSKNVTEMGLACVVNDGAEYKYYWTQDFATPR